MNKNKKWTKQIRSKRYLFLGWIHNSLIQAELSFLPETIDFHTVCRTKPCRKRDSFSRRHCHCWWRRSATSASEKKWKPFREIAAKVNINMLMLAHHSIFPSLCALVQIWRASSTGAALAPSIRPPSFCRFYLLWMTMLLFLLLFYYWLKWPPRQSLLPPLSVMRRCVFFPNGIDEYKKKIETLRNVVDDEKNIYIYCIIDLSKRLNRLIIFATEARVHRSRFVDSIFGRRFCLRKDDVAIQFDSCGCRLLLAAAATNYVTSIDDGPNLIYERKNMLLLLGGSRRPLPAP